MLNKYRISLIAMASFTASAVAQPANLSQLVPPLAQGQSWTVSLQQYDIHRLEDKLGPARLLTYTVSGSVLSTAQASG